MTSKTTGNTGFSASVKEFVESYGGNHEIKKVLVANNGIGAVKAIRSIRKWAFETFGDETAVGNCACCMLCAVIEAVYLSSVY